MRVVLYHNHSDHQRHWMGHFSAGLKCHNVDHQLAANIGTPVDCDIAVIWGVHNQAVIEHQQRTGGDYIVLERGFFRNRFEFASAGFNGLNGRADFCADNSPPDRWIKHGVGVRDWRDDGSTIFLIGQVKGDAATAHIDLDDWYRQTIRDIRDVTGRAVVFRPHPQARQNRQPVRGVPIAVGNLGDLLSSAFCVVTFNSNTGVEAALAGAPVIAMDEGAMAWPVASHHIEDISNLKYPNRDQWLYNLAYSQWTTDEIAAGETWAHLTSGGNYVTHTKHGARGGAVNA